MTIPQSLAIKFRMPDAPLEILYHDGPVLVVNKPAGISTQSPPGIESLETRVKDFLRAHEDKTGNIYLGVPHRLDRASSGGIVFARHVRAARRLAQQFESRTVEKTYWALLAGQVEPPAGTWRDTMRKIPDQPRSELVAADHPDAREAILHYRTLGQTPQGCWLEIKLETGRMHQIRLQAAVRGHAVLGDALYGSTIPFGPSSDDPRQRAIALHARRLAFEHPKTRQRVEVEAPLPPTWESLGVDFHQPM